MVDTGNILISVEGRHAASMVCGTKTVELRRRAIRVPSGCRVWIYSKTPRGSLEALGIVANTVEAAPEDLWKQYGAQCAIALHEFESYFAGITLGCAILFRNFYRLNPILSLGDIRAKYSTFQPPQFFKKLPDNCPELTLFQSALPSHTCING